MLPKEKKKNGVCKGKNKNKKKKNAGMSLIF